MQNFHPLLRLRCRAELRRQGKGPSEINSIMANWDDDMVPVAVGMLNEEQQAAVGALGDGTILEKILEFLKSPAGQALLQILLQLLMGL